MSQEVVAGFSMARGTALVNIDRLYSSRYSREPRTEHWLLSVTYYLNPREVSEEARIWPQFETINPLGLSATAFHLSATPGTIAAAVPASGPEGDKPASDLPEIPPGAIAAASQPYIGPTEL